MFHFNHNWSYYGTKTKWSFKGNTKSVDQWLYPERKCLACGRIEQLEGVIDIPMENRLSKTWTQIYKSKYEADPLLDVVRKVYYAGTWNCEDIGWQEAKGMWEELRDAAGFEPGGTSE